MTNEPNEGPLKVPEEIETFEIMEWLRSIVCGAGGFQDFEMREGAIYNDRDVALAEFVVRAIANVDCYGSEDMLNAIIERRAETSSQ